MSDDPQLFQSVDAELAAARKRLQAVVDRVCTDSEGGVLAAGGMLHSILETSRHQAEVLSQFTESLGGSSKSGATAMVGETSAHMREFLTSVSQQLGKQNETIAAASSTMQQILEAGGQIERVATASRFLALNAVIEANRLGEAGNISRAIAREMTELSQSVAKANALVAKLAGELAASMPRVVEGATQLIDAVGQFRQRFDTQLGQVDGAFADLTDRAQRAARDTEGQTKAILESTQLAIQALSFHDPMVKAVRGMGKIVEETRARVARRLGAGTSDEPPAQAPVEAEPAITAGDVELF